MVRDLRRSRNLQRFRHRRDGLGFLEGRRHRPAAVVLRVLNADRELAGNLTGEAVGKGRGKLLRALVVVLGIKRNDCSRDQAAIGRNRDICRVHGIDLHVLCEVNLNLRRIGGCICHLWRGLRDHGGVDLGLDRRHREIAVLVGGSVLAAVRVLVAFLRELHEPLALRNVPAEGAVLTGELRVHLVIARRVPEDLGLLVRRDAELVHRVGIFVDFRLHALKPVRGNRLVDVAGRVSNGLCGLIRNLRIRVVALTHAGL